MSELFDQARLEFEQITGVSTEDTSMGLSESPVVDVNVPKAPANAEQIAARNAFTESSLTGEPLDKTFAAYKFDTDNIGLEQAERRSQATTEYAMAKGKEANLNANALSGDSEKLMASQNLDPASVTSQEAFVATVAKDDVDLAKLDKFSKSLRATDKINELIARAEDEKVWGLDTISSLINNVFFPGHTARVDSEIIATAMGNEDLSNNLIASEKVFNTLKDYINFMGEADRELFLENLYNIATEESGVLFDNPEEVRSFFTKLLQFTAADAKLQNTFTAVDLTTYPVALVALMTKSVLKNGNAAVANALANREIAARSVASDIVEGTSTSGVPESELVAAALKAGKNPYTADGQLLAGAEEDIKLALAEQAASRDIKDLIEMSGPTGIDPSEYANLVKKYTEFYEAHSSKEYQAFSLTNVDDTGITYRVDIVDPSAGGFYTREHAENWLKHHGGDLSNAAIEETSDGLFRISADYKHTFTLDDVSPLSLEPSGLSSKLPSFVQFPLQTLDPQVVTTRVLGVHQEDAARHAYERLWKDATKGLTAKSNAKVDIMLKKGDAQSKVFKPEELESYGLTPKEQISYYKKRTIRDVSHVVHDKALVDRLNFLGLKKISYSGEAEAPFDIAGKVMTEEEAIKYASSDVRIATNLTGTKAVETTLDTATIREIYKRGGSVVRSANQIKIGTDYTDTFVLKNSDSTVSKIDTALPYRPGEVSRIYDDPYFVSMGFKGKKNGKVGKVFNTLRTAPTRKAAQEWADGMNNAMRILRYAASEEGAGFTGKEVVKALSKYVDKPREVMDLVKSGEIPLDAEFKVKFDREIVAGSADHTEAVVETLFSTGRLFTSKRNDRLLSVLGDEAPIKSPKEAMAQELSYVSRFMNTSVWRETAIEKLLKTFDGKLEYIQGATKYENALFAKPMDMTLDEERYLKVLRNHVRTQLGIPSEDAIKWKKRMEAFASAMEGKGKIGEWVSRQALGIAHGSVSQALRTMVFHSYLGLGNVAQFFVQANGALIAASVHPTYGLIAAKNASVLRLGVLADSVGRKDVLDKLAKINVGLDAGASSVKDFVDTVQLIRKSGILNSIKSSALHYVKEGAVDLDTHLAAYTNGLGSAARRTGSVALKAGLIPFNRGEEFARIVALDVARREWMKANPGKDFLSRGAVNEILARQEVLTLGMSRANVGRIQQGVLSIPFQFAQYNWKLMETLLGKRLTGVEKARVMGMATLLYGSEGMGATFLYNEMFGDADLTKEQKLFATEGAISWAIYKATGAETAVGTRIGPLRYFVDQIKDMASGDLTAAAAFAGPAGSFLSKEAEFLKEVVRIYNVEGIDLGDKSVEYLGAALKTASAGYSSATKYLHAIYSDGYIRTKSGQRLAKISNLESWLSIMGIKNLKEVESNKMYDLLTNQKEVRKDLANGLATLWSAYYAAPTKAERDNLHKQITAYLQSIDNGLLEDEVFDMARRKVYSDPLYEQQLRRIEQQILEGKLENTLLPNQGEQ